MTDTTTIDSVIKKEKARTAKAEYKLKVLTAKDAGMPEELAELFVDARGDRYVMGQDGKIRHRKSQVEMHEHLTTKVRENRPTFFGIAEKTKTTTTTTDPAMLELETLAFVHGNITSRGALVKQLGEAGATERAKAWGLRNLMDSKTRGVRPEITKIEAAKAGNKADNKPDSNPFLAANWNATAQSRLYRLDPGLCASMAEKAGVKIGATKPVM
jgi:hypothetical protein